MKQQLKKKFDDDDDDDDDDADDQETENNDGDDEEQDEEEEEIIDNYEPPSKSLRKESMPKCIEKEGKRRRGRPKVNKEKSDSVKPRKLKAEKTFSRTAGS